MSNSNLFNEIQTRYTRKMWYFYYEIQVCDQSPPCPKLGTKAGEEARTRWEGRVEIFGEDKPSGKQRDRFKKNILRRVEESDFHIRGFNMFYGGG